MTILPTHRPFNATVVFCKDGEPEIIMQETFKVRREYPADIWAREVARVSVGYAWLVDAIVVISITYWYTTRQAPTFTEEGEFRGDAPQGQPQEQSADDQDRYPKVA